MQLAISSIGYLPRIPLYIAWDRMKDQLAANFAEVSDKQQAFSLLQIYLSTVNGA